MTRTTVVCLGLCAALTAHAQDGEEPALARDSSGESRLQLSVGASAAYSQFFLPAGVGSESSVIGGADVAATLFVRPLLDDDAPLSLQPFLQRATTVRLSVGGGGFDTSLGAAGGGTQHYYEHNASVGLSVDAYLRPEIAITASAGVTWAETRLPPADWSPIYRVPLSAGVGLRFTAFRLDFYYRIQPFRVNGNWDAFYGGFGAGARWVIDRKLDLTFGVVGVDSGLSASFGVAGYPTRRVGVFGGIIAGHGGYFAQPSPTYDWIGASLGISLWRSRHFGASLSYAITWLSGPRDDELVHGVGLTLTSRVR